MKKYHIILIMFFLSATGYSQFADDALRFSQVYYQGTARSMAVGGAFGALGADFSTASTNPAGMGMYRTGEFIFTPEVFSRNVSSLYNGSLAENSRTILDISNMGYVMVTQIGSQPGWKFFQFSVGMNRLNNFNSSIIMEGENIHNSKLDVYAELADGKTVEQLDDFELYPAWETYLINPDENNYYYTPVPFGGVLQQQRINTRGSINEWLVSFSGNYNDILFVGATIGLPYLRYFRESTYSEFDVADTIPYFDNWSTTENLATTGWGINLKIGAIVKPVDWLRIGAAFHTPTYYWSMSDTWFTNTTSYLQLYENDSTDDLIWTNNSYESPVGNYDYHLSTPLRAIGSASVLIGRHGFISGEYEYANYSTAKFSSKYDSFSSVNQDIKSSFQSTHNFRAGTEWRFSNFSFRGGYALYGSPYANDLNDGKRQMYSGGIGYKTRYYAVDFAYVYSKMNEDYYMYTTQNIQPNAVNNQFTTSSFVVSVKFFMN
ncbi:MAG: hypothetical protein QM503_15390 [Bacteroidota bacterium]